MLTLLSVFFQKVRYSLIPRMFAEVLVIMFVSRVWPTLCIEKQRLIRSSEYYLMRSHWQVREQLFYFLKLDLKKAQDT